MGYSSDGGEPETDNGIRRRYFIATLEMGHLPPPTSQRVANINDQKNAHSAVPWGMEVLGISLNEYSGCALYTSRTARKARGTRTRWLYRCEKILLMLTWASISGLLHQTPSGGAYEKQGAMPPLSGRYCGQAESAFFAGITVTAVFEVQLFIAAQRQVASGVH